MKIRALTVFTLLAIGAFAVAAPPNDPKPQPPSSAPRTESQANDKSAAPKDSAAKDSAAPKDRDGNKSSDPQRSPDARKSDAPQTPSSSKPADAPNDLRKNTGAAAPQSPTTNRGNQGNRTNENQAGSTNRNSPTQDADRNKTTDRSPNGNPQSQDAATKPQSPSERTGSRNDDDQNAANPKVANDPNRVENNARTNRSFSNRPEGDVNNRTNVDVNGRVNTTNRTNVNARADRSAALTQSVGLAFGAAAANGLTVQSIQPTSAFTSVGLMPGDQLVSIGGNRITSVNSFSRYLYGVPVGQRVPVVVWRNGAQQTLYWTPDQSFTAALPQSPQPIIATLTSGNNLGIQFDETVRDAAVVVAVAQDSPADRAGVQVGDAIVAVNDQPIDNPNQFREVLSQVPANEQIRLALDRQVQQNVQVDSQPQTVTAGRPITPATPAPAVPNRGPVRRIFRNR
jgi:C-terminal processing protease CtpA/Prc